MSEARVDYPVTSDCAIPPGQSLIGDESQMLAIIRGHYGQPHTCEGTCDRYHRERLLTLRERLHEMLHVGDPQNWRCYHTGDCPLLARDGFVEKILNVVTEWIGGNEEYVDGAPWLAEQAKQ